MFHSVLGACPRSHTSIAFCRDFTVTHAVDFGVKKQQDVHFVVFAVYNNKATQARDALWFLKEQLK